jgi:hypothetical protein
MKKCSRKNKKPHNTIKKFSLGIFALDIIVVLFSSSKEEKIMLIPSTEEYFFGNLAIDQIKSCAEKKLHY